MQIFNGHLYFTNLEILLGGGGASGNDFTFCNMIDSVMLIYA